MVGAQFAIEIKFHRPCLIYNRILAEKHSASSSAFGILARSARMSSKGREGGMNSLSSAGWRRPYSPKTSPMEKRPGDGSELQASSDLTLTELSI